MPKRKSIKPKTREEIEVEIKRAEEFAKEHPTSIFGDDNVRKVAHFKRICNAYLSGKSLGVLDAECQNEDFDDDDEEAMEKNSFENDIINWLRGENVTGEEHFW